MYPDAYSWQSDNVLSGLRVIQDPCFSCVSFGSRKKDARRKRQIVRKLVKDGNPVWSSEIVDNGELDLLHAISSEESVLR